MTRFTCPVQRWEVEDEWSVGVSACVGVEVRVSACGGVELGGGRVWRLEVKEMGVGWGTGIRWVREGNVF